MSEPQLACNDDSLIALLSDDFSDQESEPTLDHLENCTRCQQRLSELVASTEEWRQAAQLISTGYDRAGSVQPISSPSLEQHPVVWTESMAVQLLSSASHPEMLGRLGRYEIEGLIGSGGMGVVFKAFDRELNRPVAIKILAPSLASSGSARKRFSREARAAAAVVHPHVIPIHNVETERESPFIVMQFVSGASLQERIDHEGPLELCEVLRIGMQVADGLSAAHDQGLVHRDIKPSNILLEEDVDRALIGDFGLARAADDASLTRTGIHAGTPQYMSPEQASGQSIDARSDLFSLGSMLYTMCTGRPPFQAESSLGVMRKISDQSPMPIRDLNPEIPEWLCSTVNKLMAKEKSERFQSAHEVQDVLESCLGHVQHPATHPLPATLTPNLKQQSSPKTLIGVFAMLTLATAVCFFFTPWNNVPLANAPVGKQQTQNKTAVKNKEDKPSNPQAEGKTPIQQISQLLGEWKKSSTDTKQAQAYAEKMRVLTEELYKPLKPHTESHRQASQQLAVICWPYVLDTMPKTMAQAIITLTQPDAAVRVSDRLADQFRPTEPLGWDIQATHALALARAGSIEQAIQENEALMKKVQVNVKRGRLPDLETEFLGANRTEKSILKQTYLQQALILALADRITDSIDASTSAGGVDVNKPTKADLLAIQALIQKIIEAQTPAHPDFSDGIKDATFVRKANNVHGETFYLRTEVTRESLIDNVRMHLGSHWRRRKLTERDMLQAAVKGRQLPATVDLSVYENVNSPGMDVHIFFLTYKTESREPNVHINVVPASAGKPAADKPIEPKMEKQPLDGKKVVGTWRSIKTEGNDAGDRLVGIDAKFTELGSVVLIAQMKKRGRVTSVTKKGDYSVMSKALVMTFDNETRSCPAWFLGDRLVVQDPDIDSRVHYERISQETADSVSPGKSAADTSKVVIRPDRQVTHITEPLDGSGHVDYLAAINQRYSQDVTPATNWTVALLKEFGPPKFRHDSLTDFWAPLGIQPISPEGPFLKGYRFGNGYSELDQKASESFLNSRGPWTANTFPHEARWLGIRKLALDRLVEAAKLPHNYVPQVTSAEEHARRMQEIQDFFDQQLQSRDPGEKFGAAVGAMLTGSLRLSVAPLSRLQGADSSHYGRELARMLSRRALLRIGEADIPAAQSDLQAIHRIGWLSGQGNLMQWIMGMAIDEMASVSDLDMVESGKLTKEQCEHYLHSLKQLPSPRSAMGLLNVELRYQALDAVQFAALHHDETIGQLSRLADIDKLALSRIQKLDWSEVMRRVNRLFDEQHELYNSPERSQELIAYENSEPQLDSEKYAKILIERAKEGPEELTEFMAQMYFDQISSRTLRRVESRPKTRRRVVQAGLAAELYRFEHGTYPESLEPLKSLVSEPLVDAFTGKPFQLKTVENSVSIYSLGLNGTDEGGVDLARLDGWSGTGPTPDDIAVSLKRTPSVKP